MDVNKQGRIPSMIHRKKLLLKERPFIVVGSSHSLTDESVISMKRFLGCS